MYRGPTNKQVLVGQGRHYAHTWSVGGLAEVGVQGLPPLWGSLLCSPCETLAKVGSLR